MINPAMLHSLQALDSAQAQVVLCRAIDYFLPNVESVELDDVAQKVVNEALAAATEQRGAEEILGDLLTDYLLPPNAESAAKTRLGQRGELAWELYGIAFGNQWERGLFESVSESEVRRALAQPNIVSHLPPAPQSTEKGSVSVAASIITDESVGLHWLVMALDRTGATLRVDAAWRVFPDIVRDSGNGLTARSLLQSFLNVFGAFWSLRPGEKKRNMTWDEIVPRGSMIVGGETRKDEGFAHAFWTAMPEGVAYVHLAYAVRMLQYRDYLTRHRVFG